MPTSVPRGTLEKSFRGAIAVAWGVYETSSDAGPAQSTRQKSARKCSTPRGRAAPIARHRPLTQPLRRFRVASGPHPAGADIDIHRQTLVIHTWGHAHTLAVCACHGIQAHRYRHCACASRPSPREARGSGLCRHIIVCVHSRRPSAHACMHMHTPISAQSARRWPWRQPLRAAATCAWLSGGVARPKSPACVELWGWRHGVSIGIHLLIM